MLFDIRALRWDEELCELLGVPRAALPEAVPSATPSAKPSRTVLGARVPLAGIAGDQQAALFGQACHSQGLAKNTYGTGSFLLLNAGAASRLSSAGPGHDGRLGARRRAPIRARGRVFVTGAAVQWLRDGLGIIADAAETEALAALARLETTASTSCRP